MSENTRCWICSRTEQQALRDFKKLVIDSKETTQNEKERLTDDFNLYPVPDPDISVDYATIPMGTELRRKIKNGGYVQVTVNYQEIEVNLCMVCSSIMGFMSNQCPVDETELVTKDMVRRMIKSGEKR